jgi:membrane fusion protein (multidrug efflux system)
MKRLFLYSTLTILLLLACGFGWHWWHHGRFVETTDNAYIRGDITPISSKVAGYVDKVLVSDNQTVSTGQPLVRIQDMEFLVRMERGIKTLKGRQAALLVIREQRRQQTSKIEIAKANLEIAKAEQQRDIEVYERYNRLYSDKVIPWIEFSDALTRKRTSFASKSRAQASLDMTMQGLNVLLAEEQQISAEIGQIEEDVKLLKQEVSDTKICAPTSGTVGNRQVQQGQYVRPGSNLMALIPDNAMWIEANFKEIQLTRMNVGQPVNIEIDAYPELNITGRIDSFAPASGAEFSLLPPENASGNFTKIVQRIPVKINIDNSSELGSKLRPGMSVEVSVNTNEFTEATKKHLARN